MRVMLDAVFFPGPDGGAPPGPRIEEFVVDRFRGHRITAGRPW